jgi:hypothetical protein
MDDAARVCRRQRIGDLNRQTDQSIGRERLAMDLVGERVPFEELEYQERSVICVANFVDRADVRMIQRRRGASFAKESLSRRTVGGVALDEFEGHFPTEDEIFGEVDLTHSSRAESLEQLIVRNGLADHMACGTLATVGLYSARRVRSVRSFDALRPKRATCFRRAPCIQRGVYWPG